MFLTLPVSKFILAHCVVMLPLYPNERCRIARFLNVCGGASLFQYPNRRRRIRNILISPGNLWVGNYDKPGELFEVYKTLVLPFIEKDRVFYASRLGLGNDLPYGPAKEWVQWLYVRLPATLPYCHIQFVEFLLL